MQFNFHLLPIIVKQVTELLLKAPRNTAEVIEKMNGKVLRLSAVFTYMALSYFRNENEIHNYRSIVISSEIEDIF